MVAGNSIHEEKKGREASTYHSQTGGKKKKPKKNRSGNFQLKREEGEKDRS